MYNKIIERVKKYNPSVDEELIIKACVFAEEAHRNQKRVSGEPYIMHPLEVAFILADMELDEQSIVAGILHDVVEDTEHSFEDISLKFGKEVAILVDGVTKLTQLTYTSKIEEQAENFRKMFIAMAKDIRVVLIKLADRLHNMRTLKHMRPEKQKEKAQETMDIYAPLAHRLGMSKIKWELEDLSFRYLFPEEYYELANKITKKRTEREEYIKNLVDTINIKLKNAGIDADIDGRPKHLYSIFRKMKNQNKDIDQIYDLFAMRVLVNTIPECYTVLGTVHELFKPIPGRFKDYISVPKANMYQSLHTTLIGVDGQPFEIQIRTWEMHRVSEYGIAAHWKYKEGKKHSDEFDEKLTWLRRLLEWERDLNDADEFMETLKIDLFTDEVFVFTPRGDVIILPSSSTPVDLAYTIHSDVGNRMIGAKVNGKLVQIDYKLRNGDRVDIITSSSVNGPSRDWLKFVQSAQAKNKIRQYYRKANKESNIVLGKEVLEKECKKQACNFTQLFKSEFVDNILKKYGYKKLEDLYVVVALGEVPASTIVFKLKEYIERKEKVKNEKQRSKDNNISIKSTDNSKPYKSSSGVVVSGIGDVMVRFSKCCNPVAGDDIVGYVTRGRGVSIHRKDCKNICDSVDDCSRLVSVDWADNPNIEYTAEIRVVGLDRDGFVLDITNVLQDQKISLKAISATTKDDKAVVNVALQIKTTSQLERIIKSLYRISGTKEVIRL